jgi:ornithine carrier protein
LASTSTHLGLSGTVRHTIQFGGFRALYTGLALPLAAQAIYKGTIFTINNILEQAIKEWKTQENYKLGNFTAYKLTLFDKFLCGFMGGAVNAALFVTPVEFVRNQQIAQADGNSNNRGLQKKSISSQYLTRVQGPLAVVRSTLRAEGPSGLWRGMTSTILRDSLGCGCFFAVMTYSQQLLSAHQEAESGPPSKSILITSGALAGVSFWLVGLPLDTMKTWIQNGSARNLQHAWDLSQREGVLNSIVSLNRGWQVAYLRGAPSAAITVVTYTSVYSMFLNHNM